MNPTFLALILLFVPALAQADGDIIASTSWAAAYARAAGATNVRVIAPEGLQHPPDYDPKPSDLMAIHEAKYLLLGGFEGFASRLAEAAGSTATLIRLRLTFDPALVESEILRLGQILGTQSQAEAFVVQWRHEVAEASHRLRQHPPRTCLVHVFLQPWAQLAGLEVRGTFGPKPLSVPELTRLAGLGAELILDNAHMPLAEPLASATGARRVVLRNFPGPGQGLLDVLHDNTALLEQGLH